MIVVFDLEGTLVDAELFPALGVLVGNQAALDDISEQGMNGRMDFRESLSRRIALIKGISIDNITRIANELPLHCGAEETIARVKRLGCIPVIISGGFDVLARRVAYELGVQFVSCNKFKIENGCVVGVNEPVITAKVKAERLIGIANWLGFSLDNCVAIGDGANDLEMMKKAGLSIAFNGRPIVCTKASVSISSGNLRDVIPYIQTYMEKNNVKTRIHQEITI